MYTVAIVEDDDSSARILEQCIEQYARDSDVEIRTHRYREATSFLEGYSSSCDIVFMDIEMPNMDGMSAAQYLRKLDSEVLLIFVTNMAQYATRGYEVDALDYMVKPYQYTDFSRKMDRALRLLKTRDDVVFIQQKSHTLRIPLRSLMSVEVRGHVLLYKTDTDHGVIHSPGTLTKLQSTLTQHGFLRCAKAFMVNIQYIQQIRGNVLIMQDDTQIPIGRAYKKEFLEQFALAIGEDSVL